ncbi:DUF2339 domain-containing protein [Chitinophagaceae bacterium LB-8]|uniref:DUF2339 domain-containing protein n=1 Tax=Paraflavisolibacter caeni TaxID=2982496 RepID=A0A9X3B9K4_9BACT|nr:DUF2339 domain-containing protein [Paraflavisolibacter caeni]MCU7552155.1 DUF2339 domain-containing protein [Paraflavisolibacter caeni]
MDIIILIALFIIFILLYNLKSFYKDSLKGLLQTVDQLTKEIRGLRSEINSLKQSSSTILPQAKPVTPREAITPTEVEEVQKKTPIPLTEKSTEQSKPWSIPQPKPGLVRQSLSQPEAVQRLPEPSHETKDSWFDNWLRNNSDLEKFIGENLVNKIGIAVLVLGIAFFVKYAIDKDWINEIGRVCIGLLCGALLVGIAHYMRNSYRSFSSVLAGGGIAVFYFTIAFAFHQYHLLSQTAAFIIMVVITSFAVVLSVLYNKIELAVIASIGGFITPFLVSTGEGNYIVLFTYLAILNIGLLSLSYFKRWPLVNVVSLFFTEFIFAGWLIQTLTSSKSISYPIALFFATAFYLIFLGMNMLYQIKNRLTFRAFDYFILLFLTATFYAAGMVLLHYWNDGAYQGLFTLAIGMLNLCFAWYFFRKNLAERNLLYLLIGLTLTFITLTIPVQLHGHVITLFWSAEAVLLLWLYQRSQIILFKKSSAFIGLLTMVSLMMDWSNAAQNSTYHLDVVFTDFKGIVTNIVTIIAFGTYGWLLSKGSPNEEFLFTFRNEIAKRMVYILSATLLFVTCIFGVNLYFGMLDSYSVPNVYHRFITYTFGIIFFVIHQKTKQRAGWLPIIVAAICLFVHFFSHSLIITLRNYVLDGKYDWLHLIAHWIGVVVLLYVAFQAIHYIKSNQQHFERRLNVLSWAIPALLVILFSRECLHLYVVGGYRAYPIASLQQQYGKAVLTILWAVCSFTLMWLGMRFRNKTLRIASLSLFSLALLKLFFADLRGISEGGKIAAFILLGVLLLTVSFMYQKLKKMIIDDVQA